MSIVPIVEGKSKVDSVPVLLRRLLPDMGAGNITIAHPFRVKRNLVVKEGELERALKQVVRSRDNVGAVLLLLDADDDPPAQLRESLLDRCRKATDLPVAVVIATRELEAWFLGAKEGFRGRHRVRPDAEAPADPEAVRGAKERLSGNMVPGARYLEVVDQPAFAADMDIKLATARCPSFAQLVESIRNLVSWITEPPGNPL